MKEFETIVTTAYWVLIGLLLLALVGRFLYFKKSKTKRVSVLKENGVFRIIRYATFIVLPIFIFGIVNFVFVLQKGNMFAPSWMKALFLIVLFVFLVSELFYNSLIVIAKKNRILNTCFMGLFLIAGVYFTALFTKAVSHPIIEESVLIELPFKGKWIATGAGATQLTNHHDRLRSQKYAIDIARIGADGKLFINDGIDKEDSNTFGAEIISPVNGTVVHVVRNLPDIPIREQEKLAGNHIVIQFQDSLFVALAHLKQGSIKVNVGDVVKTGELLAEVGLSGNTDFCHLHIHIQDRPIYDIENGSTYPIRFKSYERRRYLFWNQIENGFLLGNDIIKN